MTTTLTLEDQRVAELKAAKEIVEKAKSEGRQLTAEERTEVKSRIEKADKILVDAKQAVEDGAMFKALGDAFAAGGPGERGSEKPKAKTLGEAFVESDAYTQAQLPAKSGGQFRTRAIDTGLNLKALTTVPQATLALGGFQELPLLSMALNRPTIADLLGAGTMSGSVLTYLKETVATNAAAAVAESGAKPASELTLTRVSETASKIATIIDVPDEVLEDLDQARSYIDGRLTLFIQMEEEDQIMNGSGTAPNMRGILNTSGIQTEVVSATGADQNALVRPNLDGLYSAITKVRTVALLEPDGVVIHPNDYSKVRLGRDANNQYYAGGPFTGAYGSAGQVNDPGLWGLRTVVTSAVAEGTAVVAAWGTGATLFRKGGITIDATNSDASKFASNITTIRAEERAGLAVFRPNAFVKVTFDWVTT